MFIRIKAELKILSSMNLSMNIYELLTSTLQILKKEQIEILELKTRIIKQEFSGGCNCRFVIAKKNLITQKIGQKKLSRIKYRI